MAAPPPPVPMEQEIDGFSAGLLELWDRGERVSTIKQVITVSKHLPDLPLDNHHRCFKILDGWETFGRIVTERVSSLYFGIQDLDVGVALRRRIRDAPTLDLNQKPGLSATFFPSPEAATVWLLTLAKDEGSNIFVIFKEVWLIIVDYFFHLSVYEQRAKKGPSLDMASNWFFKISSIREVLPRLSCEISIFFTILFPYPNDAKKLFNRYTCQLRGVTNLFTNAYLRLLLLRKGRQLVNYGLLQESDLLACFDDFVAGQHARFMALEVTNHQSIQYFEPLMDELLSVFLSAPEGAKKHIKEKSLQWNNPIWAQRVDHFFGEEPQ